jgi:hypothetical protein
VVEGQNSGDEASPGRNVLRIRANASRRLLFVRTRASGEFSAFFPPVLTLRHQNGTQVLRILSHTALLSLFIGTRARHGVPNLRSCE